MDSFLSRNDDFYRRYRKHDYELRLCIRFRLEVTDSPDVPTDENFTYIFEAVFIQVFDDTPAAEFEKASFGR